MMHLTSPPLEWLEINNLIIRDSNKLEIINGKEKGLLWNAVYLMYQGDCFETQTTNKYRHQLAKPFYSAAKDLIAVDTANKRDDVNTEHITYLKQMARTNFLSATGFQNSKPTKAYSNSDLQLLYNYECMLNEEELDEGIIKKLRTNAEIYRRIAKKLDLTPEHIKREILKLNKS
ncbi:hypothetical protein L4C54_21405 [Vibrio lamellibrachiae]|uniref:AsnC family protein n=1 Tax=Vibrio lamellibrachiae TaxID=2910253 RepID=UPI003D0ED364